MIDPRSGIPPDPDIFRSISAIPLPVLPVSGEAVAVGEAVAADVERGTSSGSLSKIRSSAFCKPDLSDVLEGSISRPRRKAAAAAL